MSVEEMLSRLRGRQRSLSQAAESNRDRMLWV